MWTGLWGPQPLLKLPYPHSMFQTGSRKYIDESPGGLDKSHAALIADRQKKNWSGLLLAPATEIDQSLDGQIHWNFVFNQEPRHSNIFWLASAEDAGCWSSLEEITSTLCLADNHFSISLFVVSAQWRWRLHSPTGEPWHESERAALLSHTIYVYLHCRWSFCSFSPQFIFSLFGFFLDWNYSWLEMDLKIMHDAIN